jgi:hypothetical protein
MCYICNSAGAGRAQHPYDTGVGAAMGFEQRADEDDVGTAANSDECKGVSVASSASERQQRGTVYCKHRFAVGKSECRQLILRGNKLSCLPLPRAWPKCCLQLLPVSPAPTHLMDCRAQLLHQRRSHAAQTGVAWSAAPTARAPAQPLQRQGAQPRLPLLAPLLLTPLGVWSGGVCGCVSRRASRPDAQVLASDESAAARWPPLFSSVPRGS